MPRFYIDPESWDESNLRLEGDEFHHCVNVLRLQSGDPVVVFDGLGMEIQTSIKDISKKVAYLDLNNQERIISPARKTKIALAQAIPKGKNMDLIIEKGTELGVNHIYPFISERTIIRLNQSDSIKKQEKWQRVAIEACKQSGQNWLPKVEQPQKLLSMIDSLIREFDLVLIASLQPAAKHLKQILLNRTTKHPESILILIGPEGDFTSSETAKAIGAGAESMTLGPITLRTETAAIYSLSVVAHELL